ncbi:MAG: hypothetical protein U9N42_02270 [Campylobacterota bacterium]|nr:hypothetical protein [Campylobacterota bacterium]
MEEDIHILNEELSYQNESTSNDLNLYMMEILIIIDNFLNDYFQDEHEVVKFNTNFIEDNQLEYKDDVDFLKLMRFISTSYNTMKANASKPFTHLIVKFYEDITNLEHIYKSFYIKTSKIDNIFITFVKNLGDISGIIKKVEISLQSREDYEPIILTKEDNEEIKTFIKKEFYSSLEKITSKYRVDIKKVTNTKFYYYNQLFWHEMNKDISIREFYQNNKNKNAKSRIGLSFFIEKYLQGVSVSVNKESEEFYNYLHKVVKVID